jgi:hypothetical protein
MSYYEHHTLIEKAEPWTKKEMEMPKYEREFIRDIQISRGYRKKKAIDWYINDYIPASKKQRRKIRRIIISDVESHYPKHKGMKITVKGSHKLPSGKPITQKEFSSKYDSFEDWNKYQHIHNKDKGIYYKRIINRHNKYPEKSLKELRGHK